MAAIRHMDKATALDVLTQKMGFALLQMQELEDALAKYVFMRLRDLRESSRDPIDEIEAAATKKPLGALLRELASASILPENLANRLQCLLKERNWLVHHLRRENRALLSDNDSFVGVTKRLDRAAEEALSCLKWVGDEIEGFAIDSGVDPASIDREADRLLASWGIERRW